MSSDASKRTDKDLQNALHDIPENRTGLPARDSIQTVETFVSPEGDKYQILKTSETDAYDKAPERKSPRLRRKDGQPSEPS